MSPTSRILGLFAALALLAAACGGGSGAETTTTTTAAATTSSSTTSSSSSTTTEAATTTRGTVPDVPDSLLSPLNGLPAVSEEGLARRVIAVKVDNHPMARPQSGLPEADAVVELLVEGGFSRFIALFHDNDSVYVGPVRSVRPTDSTIAAPLDATLIISGGQPWVQNLAVQRGVPLMSEGSAGFFRIGSRPSPHNLYGDTTVFRETADSRGFGDEFGNPFYEVDEWESLPETLAPTIELDWAPGHQVTWRFQDGEYLRWEGSAEHRWISQDGQSGGQLSADVLVILVGTQYTATGGGKSLPATETTGSGQAYVFSEGRVMSGTWTRASVQDSFTLTADDGSAMTVPPGRPWIQIFPHNRFLDW
jgi:hypothetical protein